MKMLKKLLFFFLFAVLSLAAGNLPVQAQPEAQVEMADALRQEGKIYVVVIVLLTVLAGLFVYLIMVDRKVARLEKQLKAEGRLKV